MAQSLADFLKSFGSAASATPTTQSVSQPSATLAQKPQSTFMQGLSDTFHQGLDGFLSSLKQGFSQGVAGGIPATQLIKSPFKDKLQSPNPVERTVANYAENRYVGPITNIPGNIKTAVSSDKPAAERVIAGLGAAGGVAALVPDPIGDILLPAIDFIKGVQASSLRGGKLKENLTSGIQAATLEKPVGLGTALTTDPKKELFGNLAELPIMIGVAGKIGTKEQLGFNKETVKVAEKAFSPEVKDFIKEFATQVETSANANKKNFGKLGDYMQSLAEALWGDKAANLTNTQMKNAFDVLLQQVEKKAPMAKFSIGLNATSIRGAGEKYNVDQLSVGNEAKSVINGVVSGDFKEAIQKVVGKKMTGEEVAKWSQASSDEIIKAIGRKNTLDLGAAQLRLRQAIAEMADKGTVTKDFLEKLRADMSFAADKARLLQQRSIMAEPMTGIGKLKSDYLRKILSVNDDIDAVLKEAKDVDWNNTNSVTEFFRKFIKPTATDWIDKLRYNSMLTSPITQEVNISSNWQGTGLVTPIQRAVEGTIDSALSIFNPSRERTRFAGEGPAYAKGYYNPETVKAAYTKMLDVLSGKSAVVNPDTRFVPLATKGTAKVVENVLDVGTRALESMDQFFKTLTEAGFKSANEFRASKGITTGIDVVKQTQKDLFRGPLTEQGLGILSNAMGAGGKVVKAATTSKDPIVRWIAKLTLPFVNIGTNLAKTGIEFGPVSGAINMIKNEDKIAQAAKMIIGGSVVVTAVPFALSNRLTFSEPTNQTDKTIFREGKMLPYAIKIGDTWVQYSKMHPAIAWQLATVAALTQAVKEKKITENSGDVIANAVWNVVKFSLDQTYYRNVSDFTKTISGNVEGLSRIVSNYPSQFIPFKAFAGWLTNAIDKYQRTPDADAGVLTQSLQQIMSKLPGFSTMVPTRTDSKGQPVEKSNRFWNSVFPYWMSTPTQKETQQYDIQSRLRSYETPSNQYDTASRNISKKISQISMDKTISQEEKKKRIAEQQQKLKDLQQQYMSTIKNIGPIMSPQ